MLLTWLLWHCDCKLMARQIILTSSSKSLLVINSFPWWILINAFMNFPLSILVIGKMVFFHLASNSNKNHLDHCYRAFYYAPYRRSQFFKLNFGRIRLRQIKLYKECSSQGESEMHLPKGMSNWVSFSGEKRSKWVKNKDEILKPWNSSKPTKMVQTKVKGGVGSG